MRSAYCHLLPCLQSEMTVRARTITFFDLTFLSAVGCRQLSDAMGGIAGRDSSGQPPAIVTISEWLDGGGAEACEHAGSRARGITFPSYMSARLPAVSLPSRPISISIVDSSDFTLGQGEIPAPLHAVCCALRVTMLLEPQKARTRLGRA